MSVTSRTINEAGDPTVLLVLGYGNRTDDATVEWLLERLAEAGYRVVVVALPLDRPDFEAAYRRPVQRLYDAVTPRAVVGHSLGGLVVAHLETAATTTAAYLAPWWGINEANVAAWQRWLVPRLPIERRILPTGIEREDLGVHLTDGEWRRLPKRVSPAFITAIDRVQRRGQSIAADATVIVSLSETVVSLRAIGRAVAADQVRLYDGGHQAFAARGRATALEHLLAALPNE